VNDDIWESIGALAPTSLDFGASFEEERKKQPRERGNCRWLRFIRIASKIFYFYEAVFSAPSEHTRAVN